MSIVISKISTQTKDLTIVTNCLTTKTPFSFDLGKHINICDSFMYALPILLPPAHLDSSLNLTAAPFSSESLLDPTADSYHPFPSASIDIPSLSASTPASPNIDLAVASTPEFQRNELD